MCNQVTGFICSESKQEITCLLEQVESLQNSLHEMLDALELAHISVATLNQENQQLTEVLLFRFAKAKDLAKKALKEQGTTADALAWLLSEMYREIVTSYELEDRG